MARYPQRKMETTETLRTTGVTEDIPQAEKDASIFRFQNFSSVSGSQCFSGFKCSNPPLNFDELGSINGEMGR
jgi:hypothetical protein